MAAQNGIVGNDNMGTDMPQTQFDDSQLKEMQKTAKFARSKEFKELKEHFNRRIEFYQKYLPDGRAVGAADATPEMGQMWIVANCLIGELSSIMNVYESAEQYVKDAKSGSSQ